MMLLDLLVPEAIQLDLKAFTQTEVLQALGGTLRELGYVRDDFVEATLEREANMPTGLPLAGSVNAALPHVDLEYVLHPAVALATLEEPVDFRQMVDSDEIVRVQLVIMLAMNEPKSQVQMLEQVSRILQSSELVDGLMACKSREEVLQLLGTV